MKAGPPAALALALALALAVLLPCAAWAQQRVVPYGEDALNRDRSRYQERLLTLYRRGLFDFMTPAERTALEGVRLEFPLVGMNANPLDYYAQPGTGTVFLPVVSLRFLEDLSIAVAWRYLRNHTLEPIDEYVAMLKYRDPGDFPGGAYPDPLTALGVPDRIWERDARIDALSLDFRNTAWAFILAHELAHVLHARQGTAAPGIRGEAQADAFALDLLGRSGTIPMGMVLYFQASVGFMPNRADYPSDAAFRAWLRQGATHPLNAERLTMIAAHLERSARREPDADRRDALGYIAERLVLFADILNDPDMQRFIARQAVLGDPEDLRRR